MDLTHGHGSREESPRQRTIQVLEKQFRGLKVPAALHGKQCTLTKTSFIPTKQAFHDVCALVLFTRVTVAPGTSEEARLGWGNRQEEGNCINPRLEGESQRCGLSCTHWFTVNFQGGLLHTQCSYWWHRWRLLFVEVLGLFCLNTIFYVSPITCRSIS